MNNNKIYVSKNINNLPKWLRTRYEWLWSEFANRQFTFAEALSVLKSKAKESEGNVNVILSELRKAGYIEVFQDPNDARKSIYKLIPVRNVLSETVFNKQKLTRDELNALLKKAADLIRTRVDYTFILVLLFYKRICDKWKNEFEQEYKAALEDGLSEDEARKEAQKATYHDFDIPEEFLWDNIRKDPAKLTENFSRAMKVLAEHNPELKDIFENIDFTQFTNNRENAEILRQLVELFSARSLSDVSPDILGDAYEWILSYFAPQKGKEGEVYTPREVIKLLIEILEPQPEQSIYDPAVGSAGMLIIAYQHLEKNKGKDQADKLFLYGQEVNPKTLTLAKMNLYIHDIKNAQLVQGDTLLYPKFKRGEKIQKFDICIANPPWNQDGYDAEVLKKGEFWKERFSYGFTTRKYADWIWIQHMLASVNETGKVGIVVDNGCLFRGKTEMTIRSRILESDLIECVILLPEKLFYNTGAPGAIIIFNKEKKTERKRKILFINASAEYEKHPEVRKLNYLSQDNINKIVDAYKGFKENEGFSRIVNLDEIRNNDYNLNVTLYVFPQEKEEEIDIEKEWQELNQLEQTIIETEQKINKYLQEIK